MDQGRIAQGPDVRGGIERWRGLALALTRGFSIPGADRSDLEQEALIALWTATRDYRPGLGSFSNFATIVIKRQLATKVKAATRLKHQPLTNSARIGTSVFDDGMEQAGSDPAFVYERKEEALELLRRVREDLSPTEARCLIGVANGLTHAQINEFVGGSARPGKDGRVRFKTVDNAINRANRKLAA